MKYSKSIKIYKFSISIINKDSFEECDREIIAELERHPEIDEKEKAEIIREVLT